MANFDTIQQGRKNWPSDRPPRPKILEDDHKLLPKRPRGQPRQLSLEYYIIFKGNSCQNLFAIASMYTWFLLTKNSLGPVRKMARDSLPFNSLRRPSRHISYHLIYTGRVSKVQHGSKKTVYRALIC